MGSKEEYQRNKDTYRNNNLKKHYGITLLEKEALLDSQNGACAICSRPVDMERGHLDHNHRTGKIRGILCRGCNHLIGNADDLEYILVEALKYLQKNTEFGVRVYDRKTT